MSRPIQYGLLFLFAIFWSVAFSWGMDHAESGTIKVLVFLAAALVYGLAARFIMGRRTNKRP
jgi:hypothetical protein